MSVFEELKRRGFCYQATDAEAIAKLLDGQEKVKFYVGFDPTGNSLHVGHLLPVMAMRILQKAGHVPIVLVGGATAQIGDPSGRQTERPIMTKQLVADNAAAIKRQLARFITLDNGEALFVDNNDWFKDVNYLDFLRETGHFFSVNRMMSQESVKARLEHGLSFLEFNYSIMQAYDFFVLNQKFGCQMQLGGQDQWGNMVAGTELVRRKGRTEVFAMTIPLLLDTNGQKFGKTSGGNNVWLDPERTNVFDYYQFWRNCDDSVTAKLLAYFSTLPMEEIERLTIAGSNINRAKEILAFEATKLAHGDKAAAEAFLAAGSKFGFADPDKKVATSSSITKLDQSDVAANIPPLELATGDFTEGKILLTKVLTLSGIVKSASEGRRLIEGNAVSLDGQKISDVNCALDAKELAVNPVTLRSGKKHYRKIILK